MKKQFKFCHIAIAFFLLGLPAHSTALAQESDIASIWNASTVDWWVSSGDEESDVCQIHWLYDDRMDVYLKQNTQGHYYFGIVDAQPNSFAGNLKAYLIVDGAEIDLGVQDIGGGQLVAVVPPSLNDFDYVRDAKILLLKSADVLYNFPLENSRENFTVYDQCLVDNGQKIIKSSAVNTQPIPLAPTEGLESLEISGALVEVGSANVSNHMSDDNYNVKDLGLFGEKVDAQGDDYISQVLDDISEPYEEGAPEKIHANQMSPVIDNSPSIINEPPIPPFHKKAKQSDDMKSDLEGIDAFSEEKVVREEKREKAKVLREYDAKSTSIIRNLTRKLSVLEKEKETLRLRLLAMNDSSVISEIVACKNDGSIEEEDAVLSEDLIEEFESIISELRAENELLNAAVMDGDSATGKIADAADTSSLKEQVNTLNQQVNDLKFENADLNKSIDEYRSMMGEWQKDAVVTDDQKKKAVDEATTFDVDTILDAAEADWGDEIERDVMDQTLDIMADPAEFTDFDQ